MAGSKLWHEYETDTNNVFGYEQDKDWGFFVGNDVVDGTPTFLYGIPKNLEPRYVYYRSANGKRSVKIIVSDPDANTDDFPQTLVITASNGEVSENAADNTLYLRSLIGEKYEPVLSVDTMLTDTAT